MGNFSFYAIITIIKFRIKEYFSEYHYSIIAPLINTILFVIIFSTIDNYYVLKMNDQSFIEFLIPGLILMTVVQESYDNSSVTLVNMKQIGSFDDYLTAPISRIEIFLSFLISSIIIGIFLAIINYIVLSLFINFESIDIIYFLYYLIVAIVFFSSMNAVRSSGSIPATIAIINGKIKVGLNNDDINILSQNNNIEKVSSHNFAISISNKNHAATTVASTIYLASKIGIKFFATGGIGGVHLDFENNFDISADLIELSKTKMNVICSGAKSILDLDKTFEILETLRIPRLGFKTNYMPGFWFYNTDKKVDHNFNDINELINYLKIRDHIDQTGSVLIFNPVPKNKSIDEKLIQKWIKLSIDKAKINSIKGKELTPFLIKEINKMSENKTLETNIELIINNAALAGKLAKKYYS